MFIFVSPFLPESPQLPGFLSVSEAFDFYSRLGIGRSEVSVKKALASVGIEEFADQSLEHCAEGVRRMLCLALATARRPELLVLDDPTRGLDPAAADIVVGVVDSLRQEGVTIFMGSSDFLLVENQCSHIGVLRRGRMIKSGKLSELLEKKSEHKLTSFYHETLNVLNVEDEES